MYSIYCSVPWTIIVADLNEMAVFESVVRAGSFTSAARALGVSKSSVSAQIARLERRLGARLLLRTTRRMRLTDIGAEYHRRCARIVAEAAEADHTARSAIASSAPTAEAWARTQQSSLAAAKLAPRRS